MMIKNRRAKVLTLGLAALLLASSRPAAVDVEARQPARRQSPAERALLKIVEARTSPVPSVASKGDDLKRVESLLSAPGVGDDVKAQALAEAASYGDVELARLLIGKGADVNRRGERGRTTLMLAAARGFYVQCGNDPLVASYTGNAELVGSLLGAGARVEDRDEEGNTALMLAAGNGRSRSVKLLLAAGADARASNQYGRTALHHAADASAAHEQSNLTLIINELVAAGADVNARDAEGKTPLGYAQRSPALSNLLVAAGATQ